jgi:primary-amine oxidase
MNTNATKAAHAPVHPLDPLSGAEMQLACDLVKAAEKLDSHARFPMVELREPPKAEVVAFKTGEYFSRMAFVLAIDRSNGATIEFEVDLREKKIAARRVMPFGEAPYGQPPIMIDDFMNAEQIVKSDEAWRVAVMKRGLSEKDLERVQVDPFSAGCFDRWRYLKRPASGALRELLPRDPDR